MQHDIAPGPRILLYAHDSYGLGHLRRSLTLAEALVHGFPSASVVLVTGSSCATFFDCPAGVDIVKLPCVSKDAGGDYVPRSLPGSLDATLGLRRAILAETFRAFAPDLLIVDHQVVGLHGEVLPLLTAARAQGTRTILGIRDVIDSPDVVAHEWSTDDCRWALANAYDRVCVYGTPEVFDTRAEYPIPPELSQRVEFTGYVVREGASPTLHPIPSLRSQVLVTMGGGEDGAERIEAYLDCLELTEPSFDSVIVTGPLLDGREARRLRRRARQIYGAEVHRSHADLPKRLAECSAVVCMAGYNTCAEVLASGKPAVLLPRTQPRREQAIRAERFERLGLATALFDLDPVRLRRAVDAAVDAAVTSKRPTPETPSLDGARQVCRIAAELLAPSGRGRSNRANPEPAAALTSISAQRASVGRAERGLAS